MKTACNSIFRNNIFRMESLFRVLSHQNSRENAHTGCLVALAKFHNASESAVRDCSLLKKAIFWDSFILQHWHNEGSQHASSCPDSHRTKAIFVKSHPNSSGFFSRLTPMRNFLLKYTIMANMSPHLESCQASISKQKYPISIYGRYQIPNLRYRRSVLASISGTICNFDIESMYFDIEVGMLRYRSTQKWKNFDIEGRYFDIEAPDIEDSSISKLFLRYR